MPFWMSPIVCSREGFSPFPQANRQMGHYTWMPIKPAQLSLLTQLPLKSELTMEPWSRTLPAPGSSSWPHTGSFFGQLELDFQASLLPKISRRGNPGTVPVTMSKNRTTLFCRVNDYKPLQNISRRYVRPTSSVVLFLLIYQ